MIVGLSGVAKSGKDSFYNIAEQFFLNSKIKTKRLALADLLKSDLYNFILNKIGVDMKNMNATEKDLIRPLMVVYGSIKRQQTSGKHWTYNLQKEIKEYLKKYDIIFITDIRYAYYPEDELVWLKQNNNGLLLHISRIDENGIFIPPANEEEKNNDPILKNNADISVFWKTTDSKNERITYIKESLEKIKNIYESRNR